MRRLLVLALIMITSTLPAVASGEATCELTPLSLPLFGGTPVSALATPYASPEAEVLTQADATSVLEMYVACTNTGDPTLVWAMFTPRWFSVQFADSEEHYLPAFEYEIANGIAPVADPLVLSSIDAVDALEGGRYAVTATFSSGDMRWTDQLILVSINGEWQIDDVILVSPPD